MKFYFPRRFFFYLFALVSGPIDLVPNPPSQFPEILMTACRGKPFFEVTPLSSCKRRRVDSLEGLVPYSMTFSQTSKKRKLAPRISKPGGPLGSRWAWEPGDGRSGLEVWKFWFHSGQCCRRKIDCFCIGSLSVKQHGDPASISVWR